MTSQLLVVEDDFALRSALVASLEVAGFDVTAVEDAESAVATLNNFKPDLVITDVQMKSMSGVDLLRFIRKNDRHLPVVLMTAFAEIKDAIEVMKLGACDYLEKPFEPKRLTKLIEKYLPKKTECKVIIEDPASKKLFEYARKIAQTSSTVLLVGESGSGKEVLSQFIHDQSQRSQSKFVAINCAAIPENMLEATLFGYEKGAFTGAHQACAGKFEQAQGGTLLLDEISEMPVMLQAKILRVLQEKEVERLGGKKTIKLDVRVIATTNRDLVKEIKEKRFREDLYYRLNVFPIRCLSLRERVADIVPLATRLLNQYAKACGLSSNDAQHEAITFSQSAVRKLNQYSWPGNVRELDNLMQRIAVLANNKIVNDTDIVFESLNVGFESSQVVINELSHSLSEVSYLDNGNGNSLDDKQLGSDMRQHEYQLIIESLKQCAGKKKEVAEQLGISARTLRYKLAKMRDSGYEIPNKKSYA
ncbi:MAG: sigma-54-dependent Fis family transcriptional regulator [Kangiella sp.]|nr:MAG: sigma-54-dependent Fis family transcriptional regulator [Kangiella sp.]